MSGTTGPLVCGKCGKMLAINVEAGAAVCVLCGFSRPFAGTSCRFPRSPCVSLACCRAGKARGDLPLHFGRAQQPRAPSPRSLSPLAHRLCCRASGWSRCSRTAPASPLCRPRETLRASARRRAPRDGCWRPCPSSSHALSLPGGREVHKLRTQRAIVLLYAGIASLEAPPRSFSGSLTPCPPAPLRRRGTNCLL